MSVTRHSFTPSLGSLLEPYSLLIGKLQEQSRLNLMLHEGTPAWLRWLGCKTCIATFKVNR